MHIELSVNPLMPLVENGVYSSNISDSTLSFANVFANISKSENGLLSVIEADGKNQKIVELCQTTINLLDKLNLNNGKENLIDEDELTNILYSFLSHVPKEQVTEFEKIISDVTIKIAALDGENNQNRSVFLLAENMTVEQILQSEKLLTEIGTAVKDNVTALNSDGTIQEIPMTESTIAKNMISLTDGEKNDVKLDGLTSVKEELVDKLSGLTSIKEDLVGKLSGLTSVKEELVGKLSGLTRVKQELVGKLEELISKSAGNSEEQELKIKPLLNQLNKFKSDNKDFSEVLKKYNKSNVSEKISNNGEVFNTLVENKSVAISMGNDLKVESMTIEGHSAIVEQVIEKVDVTQIKNGNSIEIKLKPDSLGSISINIETTLDSIKAEIVTSNQQVQEVLIEKMSELTAALADKGVKPELIKVTLLENNSNNFNHDTSFNSSQSSFSGQKNTNKYMFQKNNSIATVLHDEISEEKAILGNSKLINVYV